MERSLKDKAISGAIWRIAEKGVNQVVAFAVGLMLARLLDPNDYGIIGLIGVFLGIANVFLDSGFGSALVQRKNRTQVDYNTVFVFNIVSSVVVYVILFFSAPFIADFYHTPILCEVTRVSGLSLLIGGLTGIQYNKLNIDLRFRTRSVLSILGTFVSGVVGITMAYWGWGVWALVWQSLISSIVLGVVLWCSAGWTPHLQFSHESFRSLFKFGGSMLGSGLINCIYGNLYTIVIGRAYNPMDVGMYNRANGYASLPAGVVMDISTSVNFPILARIQDDNDRLIAAYEKLLRIPCYLLYPLLTGLVVCAEPLVQIMIGDKWLPCVPYLQILSFGYMFYPLNGFNMNLLYVKGRSDLALKMDFVKKPIGIALLVASIPFGITWMMVGKAAYSVIVYGMNCYCIHRIMDYGFLKQSRILIPMMLTSLVMAAAVWGVMLPIATNVMKLAVGIPVGIIIYLVIGIIRHDTSLFEIVDILKAKIFHRG